ncbi:unnamed protein product [Rhizoctonia solani]|nr:unnamed protein product [Rhizoctonia solani]
MSGARTPPRPRIASQISSTGTIDSENILFKDEVLGREFPIPFSDFSRVFLLGDNNDIIKAISYQNSEGFQQPYREFYQRTSAPENNDVYAPLVQSMNFIVHSERTAHGVPDAVGLHFTSSTSTKGIRSATGIRKPDICGSQSLSDVAPVTWNLVSVACEYKRPSQTVLMNDAASCSEVLLPHTSGSHSLPRNSSHNSSHPTRSSRSSSQRTSPAPPIERGLQLGRYLFEMRSHQVTRESVLGILFLGPQASFWYADSDSTIKSDYIPVDSLEFIAALICLTRANPEKLGYSPHFLAQDGSVITSQPINTARFTRNENSSLTTTYRLDDTISRAPTLHGRCSRVIGATLPGLQEPCVLKLSYQVVSCDSEAVLIRRAQERGVTGLIRVHTYFTLRKLSEGPRSRLPPAYLNHLLAEDRELRVLVLARCTPLYCVSDPRQFLTASISLLNTICDLYEKGKILHGDISVNNLMVESANPSVGVLIDLDHGVDLLENGNKKASESSLHRTGTLPFMALDLLHDNQTYPQDLRHDLESFVYVLFWIAGRYDSGSEVNNLVFNEWCQGTWDTIYSTKYTFVMHEPPYHNFQPTPGFEFLSHELAIFRQLLGKAHSQDALPEATPSHTTSHSPMCPEWKPTVLRPSGMRSDDLGGVNRDNFLSILNNALGTLPPIS